MTPEQRLQFKVSDMILEVVDSQYDLTRGDLQGIAEATAQKIVSMVREVAA